MRFVKLADGRFQAFDMASLHGGTPIDMGIYRLCVPEDEDRDDWREKSVILYDAETMEPFRVIKVDDV
jgi:hypothetical protein